MNKFLQILIAVTVLQILPIEAVAQHDNQQVDQQQLPSSLTGLKAGISNPSQNFDELAALLTSAKSFMEAYGYDLRNGDRQAVANRYDQRGAYFVGQGRKELDEFNAIQKRYLESWHPPVSFAWRELSYEPVGNDAVVVTGLFDWGVSDSRLVTLSYTGLLLRDGNSFKIRLEDESLLPSASH